MRITHVISCHDVSTEDITRTLESIYSQRTDSKLKVSTMEVETILINDGGNSDWWSDPKKLVRKVKTDKKVKFTIKQYDNIGNSGRWSSNYTAYEHVTGDYIFTMMPGDTLPTDADARIIRDFFKYHCDILGINYIDLETNTVVKSHPVAIIFTKSAKPVYPIYTNKIVKRMVADLDRIPDYSFTDDVLELVKCHIIAKTNYHLQGNATSPIMTRWIHKYDHNHEWFQNQIEITTEALKKYIGDTTQVKSVIKNLPKMIPDYATDVTDEE